MKTKDNFYKELEYNFYKKLYDTDQYVDHINYTNLYINFIKNKCYEWYRTANALSDELDEEEKEIEYLHNEIDHLREIINDYNKGKN